MNSESPTGRVYYTSGAAHGYKVKRPLRIDEGEGLVYVPLTRGRTAVVSVEDLAKVAGYNWSAHSDGYAVRPWNQKERQAGRRVGVCYLHRWISDSPPDKEVDHIDGDPLNNHRSNLRLGTHRDNLNNRRTGSVRASKAGAGLPKGVRRTGSRYGACVQHEGRSWWFGTYSDPSHAWIAVCVAREHLHGPFANHGYDPWARAALEAFTIC